MKPATCCVIYLTFAAVSLFVPSANAQSPGSDLRQSLTGGFLYAVPIGSYHESPVPGYTINYAYRPLNWLALEAGFNQVIHPVGAVVQLNNGIPSADHTNDQLFLVPFGPRFIWQPNQGRGRVSVGAGGAYLNHRFDQQAIASFDGFNTTGLGAQAVVSTDYALSDSGRYRLGLTARIYYVPSSFKIVGYSYHEVDRVFTIGTEFSFSFPPVAATTAPNSAVHKR